MMIDQNFDVIFIKIQNSLQTAHSNPFFMQTCDAPIFSSHVAPAFVTSNTNSTWGKATMTFFSVGKCFFLVHDMDMDSLDW